MPSAGKPMTMLHRLRPWLPTLFGLLLFCVALWVLGRELRHHPPEAIVATMQSIPRLRLLLSLMFGILCYLLLTAYDEIALRMLGRKVRYRSIAFASFVSYAFGNNLGMSAVTAGSVRFRFYSHTGLSMKDVVAVTACCSLTFWLGFLALTGLVFLVMPPSMSPFIAALPFHAAQALGAVFLGVLLLYFLWNGFSRTPVKVGRFRIPSPPLRLSLAQTIVAALEMMLVAGMIYVLLPPGTGLGYLQFLGLFLLAHLLGLASQVPGGIGVFETALIELLPVSVPVPASIGALLVYRIMYNLIPLALAATLVALREVHDHRAARRHARDCGMRNIE
ncbi:MAG: hypothetical protein Greene041619_15 [Candidatus Peregrinibacteria bacterium Greene0416_19]|nr:MAG: hypothetical protein Greene041619_15 [Candidatus Peregrinibacteria bacterium Greene0416_19]